jgi:hypothetical protein
LAGVRVHDADGRFICAAGLLNAAEYGEGDEKLAGEIRPRRSAAKIVKAYKKAKAKVDQGQLEMMAAEAARNIGNDTGAPAPKTVIPVNWGAKAVGTDYTPPAGSGFDADGWDRAPDKYQDIKRFERGGENID